jgi:transposase InsO family protein
MYAAIRKHGVPEILVSDNGSVFISHATRRVCEPLGIEKREIKKGRPYQNYIEAAFKDAWPTGALRKCTLGRICWQPMTNG